WLIAAHQVRWHQRLGFLAVALAVLVIASGLYLTVAGLEQELKSHRVGRFHFLLGLNLANLFVFAVFIVCGLLLRRRPEYHKRFMTLAAIALLAPATSRIALLFTHELPWQYGAFYACIAACVLVDTVRHKRLHPVFIWGPLLIFTMWQLVYFVES